MVDEPTPQQAEPKIAEQERDEEHRARDPREMGERIRELADESEAEAEREDLTATPPQKTPDEPEPKQPPDEDEEPSPPSDPTAHKCGICDGWGITQTGSIVPQQQTRQCPACFGIGWVEEGKPQEEVIGVTPAPPPEPEEAPSAEPPTADGASPVVDEAIFETPIPIPPEEQ